MLIGCQSQPDEPEPQPKPQPEPQPEPQPKPPHGPSRMLVRIIKCIHILVILLLITFVIIAFICLNAGRGIEAPYALVIAIVLITLQFTTPVYIVNHLPFLLSLWGKGLLYQFTGALCVGTFPEPRWNRWYWEDRRMETTAFSLGCAILGLGIILSIIDFFLRCIKKTHLVPDLYVAPLDSLDSGPVVLGAGDLEAPPRFSLSSGDWKPDTKDVVPASPVETETTPLLVRVDEQEQTGN